MAWVILVLAGLFEVGWAIGLKYTEGVGAVGTVILGIVLLGEPANATRLISVTLIIAGIIGLKLATPA
jgi:quaternary ammonium compound-resistance protein SugE